MNPRRAYLIIPKLIEQSTWGGSYIAGIKGWKDTPVARMKIGQSYELSSNSFLSLAETTADPSFAPELQGVPENSLSISQLIGADPEGVLGTEGMQKFHGSLKTLIKFTQGKGNSFQLHVKPGTPSHWIPKPESWYYIQSGKATLGLARGIDLVEYEDECRRLEEFMNKLSERLHAKQIPLDEARRTAQEEIANSGIYTFVNTVPIPEGSVVDLDQGGVHHSWEEDDAVLPQGNILYEVQVDVPDVMSTIRSFDKGKILDDGSVRPLQIADYFKYIDTNPAFNNPDRLIHPPKALGQTQNSQAWLLFDTDYYRTSKISFRHDLPPDRAQTGGTTFHHYFVLSGSMAYKGQTTKIAVGTGHSLFIPAAVEQFTLTAGEEGTTVLKTYL